MDSDSAGRAWESAFLVALKQCMLLVCGPLRPDLTSGQTGGPLPSLGVLRLAAITRPFDWSMKLITNKPFLNLEGFRGRMPLAFVVTSRALQAPGFETLLSPVCEQTTLSTAAGRACRLPSTASCKATDAAPGVPAAPSKQRQSRVGGSGAGRPLKAPAHLPLSPAGSGLNRAPLGHVPGEPRLPGLPATGEGQGPPHHRSGEGARQDGHAGMPPSCRAEGTDQKTGKGPQQTFL